MWSIPETSRVFLPRKLREKWYSTRKGRDLGKKEPCTDCGIGGFPGSVIGERPSRSFTAPHAGLWAFLSISFLSRCRRMSNLQERRALLWKMRKVSFMSFVQSAERKPAEKQTRWIHFLIHHGIIFGIVPQKRINSRSIPSRPITGFLWISTSEE